MFCSKCGKKVLDSMLFCPFCGAGIVIPDQDAVNPPEPAQAEAEPREDLSWMEPADEAEPAPEEAPARAAAKPAPPRMPEADEAPDLHRSEHRPEGYRVPVLPKPPEDLFLDEEAEAPDDYDAFEEAYERDLRRSARASSRDAADDDDDYDDDDGEGFFRRHLRGMVALFMVLALLVGLGCYALTDGGQTLLARAGLDLPFVQTEVFSRLGYAAYQSGDYSRAGSCYEKALSREPDSYDYAQSAVMAYMAMKDDANATRMLVKCIEIKPEAAEPYVYLTELYPNAAARPAEIEQLLQQGYEKTGDARLNGESTQ